MTSQPTRSATFPSTPTALDHVYAAGKGAVAGALDGVLPGLGSATVELLGLYVSPPLEKRRTDFLNDLAARLQGLEEQIAEFKLSTLGDNEAFAPFLLGAIQSVLLAQENEKRELLMNAALNVAVGNCPAADRLQVLRGLLSSLTFTHFTVLGFFAEPQAFGSHKRLNGAELTKSAAAVVTSSIGELKEEAEFVELIVQELMANRLLAFPQDASGVLPPGAERLYALEESCLSPLGQQLRDLVVSPVEP